MKANNTRVVPSGIINKNIAMKLFCYRYATSKQSVECHISFLITRLVGSVLIYAFIKVHSTIAIISLNNIAIYVTLATFSSLMQQIPSRFLE